MAVKWSREFRIESQLFVNFWQKVLRFPFDQPPELRIETGRTLDRLDANWASLRRTLSKFKNVCNTNLRSWKLCKTLISNPNFDLKIDNSICSKQIWLRHSGPVRRGILQMRHSSTACPRLTGRSWLERHFRTSSSPAVLAQKFGVQSLSKFSKHQNEMRRISPIFREFCKVLNLKLATPKQPALLGTICNRPEVCVHLLRRNKEIDEKWGTHVCEYSNFNSFDFWGPSVLPIEADSLE